jgi:hypothetical protein
MTDSYPPPFRGFNLPQKKSLSKSEKNVGKGRRFSSKQLLRGQNENDTQKYCGDRPDRLVLEPCVGSRDETEITFLNEDSFDFSYNPSLTCLKVRSQIESLAQSFGSDKSSTVSTKSVDWKDVQIRTYKIVLGDNPAVSIGPPIAIGWNVCEETILDIESYENYHPYRRCKLDMQLPSSYRFEWLLEEGYSHVELRKAIAEVQAVQAQRLVSFHGTLLEKFMRVVRGRPT